MFLLAGNYRKFKVENKSRKYCRKGEEFEYFRRS